MYQEIPDSIPLIRIYISARHVRLASMPQPRSLWYSIQSGKSNLHILHTAPHTRLQSICMPAEQPHHHPPAQCCKHRPCIYGDSVFDPPRHDTSFGYTQLRQAKSYAGEDIDNYLLIHTALYASAENHVSAHYASEEGIILSFFACGDREGG